MTATSKSEPVRVGDWLDVKGVPGCVARRGQIVGVLGRPGRRHFRVRWDEQHESIVYPADGAAIVRSLSRDGGTRP